ncbi:efflux RND transporter periplasmic adaptor subunit [Fodinibius halophilus]|uniref:Efflux RND transporter periplasmic adaptor subunit n=1 Tax=Fodinibius halophilus TaxID=1736908 RepID=A0A6M1SZ07_9BACT|nr:efflux RND transporter periplasmic adaptor subunit [Fodinibius halophilus]NGP89118.1 efflux RND transporter periplasmic adaptor subunit [Fodinibius halophilus]
MNKQLILVGIIALVLLSGCSEEQKQATEKELVKTVNVETKQIAPQSFERYLKLVGTVESRNDVRISAEVSGRIKKYFVDQGDEVKKGEPILKIDDSQLIRERERLEAITAQAKESYERLKRLFKQDSVGSEIDYLNAKYNYQQNKASLEAVKVNIEKSLVTAPFDASVENIVLEEGEMASPGAVLVRLIGVNRLKVTAGVPSTYSDVVQKGDRAEVWFDFQQADTMQLPIKFVGKSIDPGARTFQVEMPLPQGSKSYKVDMIANVKIRTLEQKDAIVIPAEIVFKNKGQNVVYTVAKNDEGNKVARMQKVTLGASYKNSVVIEEGLKADDQLITVGASFLQDQMRINIVENKDEQIAQKNS